MLDTNHINELMANGPYLGAYHGEHKELTATFRIQPSAKYRDTIELLYQIFQDNHIPWRTINVSYLEKFYDVFMATETKETKIDNPKIDECSIWFGEYAEFVKYNKIPLWNLERITFDSSNFMLPCVDGIYFEHEFDLSDKEEGDGYLIQSNEDILEIRHESNKIVIKSQQENFEEWEALRLIQRGIVRSLDYVAPILTNKKNDTFFRRYSESCTASLMTKTDLFRRIMEMDISQYIEVVGYEICENPRDYPLTEGMNWFVRDELFPIGSRKVLLLQFQAKNPGNYLNDSMVRFVISQLQMEISEYRCVGVII